MTIPFATEAHRRTIDAAITTRLLPTSQGRWVTATYTTRRAYADPNAAPVFARMSWTTTGGWQGVVELQTFARTEGAALRALLDTLQMTGLHADAYTPTQWGALNALCHDLNCTTISTPWAEQPFPRKRRKRLRWRDETGRRVNIYADTLRDRAHLPPRKPDATENEDTETND